MSAEKVVKLGNDYEFEVLKENYEKAVSDNELIKSMLTIAAAEKMERLEYEVKELKDKNLKLEAVIADKDKLLAEKDKQIAYSDENIDLIAGNKAQKKIQEIKNDYERQLRNAKSNGSKAVSAKNKQITENNKTLNDMYNSLLAEFRQVNDKLDTHTELLYTIIDILNNSSNINEAKKEIDELVKSTELLEKKAVKTKKELIEEDKKIIEMLNSGMLNGEVADIIYSHLKSHKVREIQLSKRKDTQRFKDLFKELVGN